MPTVLLIDDEPLVRATIRRFLERDGHAVIEAENGVAGLGMVEVNDIDLVVTDIVMPEKEGLEVIRTLRTDRPELPVIAITGGGGDASKALSYAEWADIIGAKVVLQKPFDREELTMAVRVALS